MIDVAAMSHADVRLCGELRVVIDGTDLVRSLRRRQSRLVAAYLAVNAPRDVARCELVELLWPEQAPDGHAATLRSILSRVRTALAEHLVDGPSTMRLELPPQCHVDIVDALAGAAQARSAYEEGRMRDALDLADGVLVTTRSTTLAGLDGPWVESLRRDVAEARLDALEVVASAGAALGGPALGDAERAARELVTDAPFRESGHLALIECLRRRGNVAEALRAYERLRELLRRELGAAPCVAARNVHLELLGETATSVDVPVVPRRRFAGPLDAAVPAPLVA